MKTQYVSAFPFSSGLGIVFITLKLAGIGRVAEWSWWWVLSPFWLPFAAVIVILIVYLAYKLVTLE